MAGQPMQGRTRVMLRHAPNGSTCGQCGASVEGSHHSSGVSTLEPCGHWWLTDVAPEVAPLIVDTRPEAPREVSREELLAAVRDLEQLLSSLPEKAARSGRDFGRGVSYAVRSVRESPAWGVLSAARRG